MKHENSTEKCDLGILEISRAEEVVFRGEEKQFFETFVRVKRPKKRRLLQISRKVQLSQGISRKLSAFTRKGAGYSHFKPESTFSSVLSPVLCLQKASNFLEFLLIEDTKTLTKSARRVKLFGASVRGLSVVVVVGCSCQNRNFVV